MMEWRLKNIASKIGVPLEAVVPGDAWLMITKVRHVLDKHSFLPAIPKVELYLKIELCPVSCPASLDHFPTLKGVGPSEMCLGIPPGCHFLELIDAKHFQFGVESLLLVLIQIPDEECPSSFPGGPLQKVANLVPSEHSTNLVLSILFKPPGPNFQLEIIFGFAISRLNNPNSQPVFRDEVLFLSLLWTRSNRFMSFLSWDPRARCSNLHGVLQEWSNGADSSTRHAAFDAAQGAVGFLDCECTLLDHVQIFIHENIRESKLEQDN
ncbi:hypothetical protein BTVI_42575 [Pitangus sulphuratus]|nr:hypothetical protein BTVI_42575 [Pitangus sulphuratus]